MKPPEPRRGGTGIKCPMVDVAETEKTGELHVCPWHRRRNTPKTRASYRRHFRRGHFEPFMAETTDVISFLTNGGYLGMKGVEAQITIRRARGGDLT